MQLKRAFCIKHFFYMKYAASTLEFSKELNDAIVFAKYD